MIRWIIEGQLGSAPRTAIDRDGLTLIDVRDLVDKVGNSPSALLAKIEAGAAALQNGEIVVVTCDFGVSRSNAVAAAILTRWRGVDFDAAIAQAIDATGETQIKLELLEDLRRALDLSRDQSTSASVLITGGTGFLGQKMAAALRGKTDVFAPRRAEIDLLGSTFLLDQYCRDHGVGTLVHLAHPRIYTNNSAMGESLTMTKNVIDVCRARGIWLVFVSGATVFSGYSNASLLATPDTPLRPKGVYGETKALQEQLIRNAVENGEIEALTLRVAPTYGPGSDRPRLIYLFHDAIRAGRRITTHRFKNGLARLQLLYVDDAVRGLVRAVVGRLADVHQLGGDEAYTPAEIAKHIAQSLGRSVEIDEALIDDTVSNVMLDSAKTRLALDWKPEVGIEEGLKRTLAAAPDLSAG